MIGLLERLALWQRFWGLPLKALQYVMILISLERRTDLASSPKLIPKFTSVFHQLLHASLPAAFPEYLQLLLQNSLSHVSDHPADGHAGPLKVTAPSPHFSRLGIIPRYSGTLSQIAYAEIEKIAREEAEKGWEIRRLAKARQRVGNGVAGWLGGMFDGQHSKSMK